MKTVFSHQHARYTAIVMLLAWLMTLGVGVAHACWVSALDSHPGLALQIQVANSLAVCAAEQTSAIKIKQFDISTNLQLAPVAWASALTIAVVDINDRPTPLVIATWRDRPVFIRFLWLTI